MRSEHITDDGDFQSDKYPWCAPGFVPLKLTDKMAYAPLMAYAFARATEDVEFSADLVMCLAEQGFAPAMEAVGMVDGKATKEPFYATPSLNARPALAFLADPPPDINPEDLGDA